jgi:flagellar biosynthetic protein FlhB
MAEEAESNEDRTEDATPERRDEFREKGNVASSRELTSVFVLAASIAFLGYYGPKFIDSLSKLYIEHFQRISSFRVTPQNFFVFARTIGTETALLLAPLFLLSAVVSSSVTLLQTRLNFSWDRVKFDMTKLDPLKGLVRMVNLQALVELTKGIAKISAVFFVSYLVLKSEWYQVPGLMDLNIGEIWKYWARITGNLFWGVAMLLVGVAGLDYAYNFFSLEQKLKMTKKEVREDYKKREVDPHVKARIRRMQRDFATKKVLDKTKNATVLVTNPEHFAIAIRYELGMAAPMVIAKGVDFLALRMRELAKSLDIPIIENKPLARTLYKIVDEDQEIPESLYKAVSEIIRYVFKMKGINIPKTKAKAN